MGKHAGPAQRRSKASAGTSRPSGRPSGSRSRLLVLALGVTATLVAWGFLVWAAIDFGGVARTGDATAWGFTALATAGAAGCLFVTLILLGKVVDALKVAPPAPEPGPALAPPPVPVPVLPGGRRARR